MKRTTLILATIMLAAVCFTSCADTPSSVTKECLSYLKAGDYAAYVDTFNATDEEKAQLLELFEKKGKATMEEKEGIESYEIIHETISEDGLTAKVNARIYYNNGEVSENNIFNLEKVNDEWKQSPIVK